MNEDAYKIHGFMPYLFKTEQEQEYIDFLWDSFQSNYKNQKYQFAFIAYHMLFMSSVYFLIWKLKKRKPEDFKKALIGFSKEVENNFLQATSPFTFSEVNESQVFRFFKLLQCDNSKIGNYVKIVHDRNSIAHSNGVIFFNAQQSADEKISEILRCIEEINEHAKHMIDNIFKEFLENNWNPDGREFSDPEEQTAEILVRDNYLSKEDIKFCGNFDINRLSANPNFNGIKVLFDSFKTASNELD